MYAGKILFNFILFTGDYFTSNYARKDEMSIEGGVLRINLTLRPESNDMRSLTLEEMVETTER